jgi:hypothetical protein
MVENATEKPKREVTLKVNNSVKLDPQNPIPFQSGSDSFYTITGKKYLPFLGRKDNLPNIFLEARLTSITHNACITSIVSSAIGHGLTVTNNENPDADFLSWTKSVNNKRKSFKKVLKIIADGERTTGNQFIEVVRGSFMGKKFMKIYPHSMLYARLAEPGDSGFPEAVLLSPDFAKRGYRVSKASKEIPLWSPNPIDKNKVWIKDSDGTERTMLHFKNEVSGIEHYGLPASVAGLKNQKRESMHEQHDIDNLENNMILGGMLLLKSAMTHDEAMATAKEILLSHVGEGKTGRIAVVSSENGLGDVDFKPFNTQKEGSFIEADKHVVEKIVAAHNWDSILAGINRDSKLGTGSAYIRSIWDAKEASLLNPYREDIIDEVVIPIAEIYADWFEKPEVKNYEWKFKSSMPFSFMGDIDPETFMTVDEARALAGLPADPVNGKKILSEMKYKSNVQTEPATT